MEGLTFPIYELDYYDGSYFYDGSDNGAGTLVLGPCPGFKLTDYDYDGNDNVRAATTT